MVSHFIQEEYGEDSKVEGDMLVLPNGKKLPVARGATALAATAIMASQALGKTCAETFACWRLWNRQGQR